MSGLEQRIQVWALGKAGASQPAAVNLFGKVPAWISLSVTFGLLLAGVLYSLYRTARDGGEGGGGPARDVRREAVDG